MKSIRRKLIATLLGVITSALLLGASAIYFTAREEAGALFDYHLRQIALSLRNPAFGAVWMPPVDADEEEFDFVIQVWDATGVRLYYSQPHVELPGFMAGGYATVETREGAWRVFAIRSRSQVIQVAQPMRVRNHMALEAALRVLLPLLLLLPVLSVAIWVLVSRGLEPLNRLARAVATRTPKALDPLPEAQAPQEARPLVRSLNDLLVRLGDALAAQQAFIADAAHELRTPIAALQLQAQLVERAETEEDRRAALDDLKAGVGRAGRAVQQLLTLARQDPDLAARPFEPVLLGELARQVVAEHLPLAEAKHIDLGVVATDDGLKVQGDPAALRVLVANLVENGLRYTPEGGRVDLSVWRAGGQPLLEVRDTGPGIPEADRARVFDRFYRGEATHEPGTGLGLSIVKTIADRHGARVGLENGAGGGLRVRVVFAA
ncbi:two-component system, OmpR family, sensor kinase [Methylomagnum ishizawai]|uniref:histidine kinase n=1 Tax=Methylomagnum ishizawai TaxID=1760988 RepID=A0A1Y6CSI2_9GAMM|nr:ATP-binding protein [Methylomagnum ishizawai]SMF93569.1 two-component system, OmpR family, sensor kinase [Methylomagnum ishizawai]